MPAIGRFEDAQDLKVRVPGDLRTELEALARAHDQSLAGIMRLTMRAGLPAVRAMVMTAPPIFDADKEVI